MGLFDRFGAGGGSVTLELGSTKTRVGDKLAGTLVFIGGKREQKIDGMQIWFVKVDNGKDELLYAPSKFPLNDTIKPGETKRFPFEALVPRVAAVTINGKLVPQIFGLRGSLDIPKEMDPQGKLDGLDIAGGLEAAVTVTPA
jgi:sporulation-control protein spo0M